MELRKDGDGRGVSPEELFAGDGGSPGLQARKSDGRRAMISYSAGRVAAHAIREEPWTAGTTRRRLV